MNTLSCGCTVGPDPASGVTRALQKCDAHVEHRRNQPTGSAYYRSLGVLDVKGEIRVGHHVDEMLDAIGDVPRGAPGAVALEIGGGVSPYVRLIQSAGYTYHGVELDPWAAQRIASTYGVTVRFAAYGPDTFPEEQFDLILSCHSLEHMDDAPATVRTMYRDLKPGGHLVLLVPDDTDLTNPDHFWFFNVSSLRLLLEETGFEVLNLVEKKVVERENFIYCVARKRV